MEMGKPFNPKINGWFVPDARMLEIMDAIGRKDVETGERKQ